MKVAFFGHYFSEKRGSLPTTEAISNLLNNDEVSSVRLYSKFKNKWLRAASQLTNALIGNYDQAFVDVYSGNSFLLATRIAQVIKLRRRPVTGVLRGGALLEMFEECPQKQHDLRIFDRIITPSNLISNALSNKIMPVSVIPNPVDLDKFVYAPRQEILQNAAVKLLWVRAFTAIYQPQLAIDCLKALLDAGQDATLTMVGPDLGLESRTRTYASKLGVMDNVAIVGPISHDLLPQYYQNHDFFLNTTKYESFGNAVAEAASSGLVVISTKVGELPFLWENNVEIVYSNPDGISFAHSIILLRDDSEHYRSISKSARQKSERLSWHEIKELWVKLLRNPT
jgi:glycosyltransferase involved in cell wall biosynthesis